MIKRSLLLMTLTLLASGAMAKPMDAKTAVMFKKDAIASCTRSLSQEKRFTATQIKSYCECHATYLSKELSLDDLKRGQVGPQDPRIIAASKACINRFGPIKKPQ